MPGAHELDSDAAFWNLHEEVKELGHGSSGKVKLVRVKSTNSLVALKEVTRSLSDDVDEANEARLLSAIRRTNAGTAPARIGGRAATRPRPLARDIFAEYRESGAQLTPKTAQSSASSPRTVLAHLKGMLAADCSSCESASITCVAEGPTKGASTANGCVVTTNVAAIRGVNEPATPSATPSDAPNSKAAAMPLSDVVCLLDVYESPATLFLLMRAELGGDLASHLASLPGGVCDEQRARNLACAIFRGLDSMHALRLVHRDLKAANVVLSAEGEGRIADLGLAERLPEPVVGEPPPLLRSVCGTHDNRAPEMVLCGHGAAPGYGCAVDLWQMGLLLYEMLYGWHPFARDTEVETLAAILAADYALPSRDPPVSDAANDLIRRLLVTDPEARPTAAECLQHDWLRNC